MVVIEVKKMALKRDLPASKIALPMRAIIPNNDNILIENPCIQCPKATAGRLNGTDLLDLVNL